ncbi:MAG: Asp-tRNA(Asn)/Glu-tRNA(Gln) amidotransferase GatCAB subunit B, partial [Gammaproteobacteria bacterium]|nr:Asp-tRNA(Asn)/Glu-tRNA(Gln) amidotransferase GatCAB subunit B [Gammaproteobacteria bacterium]
RCDANVSLRRAGASELGTRAEIKNLNSFRFVEKAIAHEIARQTEILESGGAVAQETRLYNADLDQTRPMRSKEDAHDYRYFPDPDLPPLVLDEEFIEAARADLPELPGARKLRFERDFQLPARDAAKLAFDRGFADYFETATAAGADAKTAANWMLGELSAALNRDGLRIEESPLGGAQLAEILARIADRSISGKSAKEVFQAVWRGEGGVDEIINARGLKQITDDSEIENVVARVVAEHPEQAAQYRAGKQKVFGFFVGRVMQASGGKAEPARVNEMLRRALDSE